jgi:TRAP-type C4-dicarboxylate transport system permease large subunit
MIIYGIMTEQSIGKLFLAGLIPGLLISACFIGIIYVCVQNRFHPRPASVEKFTIREKMRSLPEFVPVVIIFGGHRWADAGNIHAQNQAP